MLRRAMGMVATKTQHLPAQIATSARSFTKIPWTKTRLAKPKTWQRAGIVGGGLGLGLGAQQFALAQEEAQELTPQQERDQEMIKMSIPQTYEFLMLLYNNPDHIRAHGADPIMELEARIITLGTIDWRNPSIAWDNPDIQHKIELYKIARSMLHLQRLQRERHLTEKEKQILADLQRVLKERATEFAAEQLAKQPAAETE